MKNQTVIINDMTLRDGEQTAGVPEMEVGREHRLVLGKHSGSRSVIEAYAEPGIRLTAFEAKIILPRIRDHAVHTKCAPDAADLKLFHLDSTPCSTAQA